MLKLKQKFQGCALTAPDWWPQEPGNLKSKASHPRFHSFRALGCHCEQFFGEHRLEGWKLILKCYFMKINIIIRDTSNMLFCVLFSQKYMGGNRRKEYFIYPIQVCSIIDFLIWLAESNAVFSKHTVKMRNYKANISDNGAWWLANKQ